MMRRILLGLVCGVLVFTDGGPLEAEAAMKDELRTYNLVLRNIKDRYIDEIPADSLLHAAVRGIMQALGPDATITFSDSSGRPDWRQSQATFERIAKAVDDNSFYNVGADTLIRFAIHRGLMSILDPDTVFMEKLSLDNFVINIRGEYGGLGFRIQPIYPDSAIAVWSMLHDRTPAALAGVESGDLIIAIDDTTTRGMSATDAAGKMRGLAGTPVTLTLKRAGADSTFDITITREKVNIESVPYYGMLDETTGYIKLMHFQLNSSREVETAIEDLLGQGMEGLIFDLRSNPGGYLQEAVLIADLFLPKDHLVVYTAGRAYRDTSRHLTRHDALFGEGPLVVLVDGASASASEIVAGAIQDWDRGLVVGSATVGKGSVQQPVPVGDRAELKITIGAYFIPSGRSIDKRMRKDSTLVAMSNQLFYTRNRGRIVRGAGGITPDIETSYRRRTSLFAQLAGWRTLNSQFFRFSRQYRSQHPELTEDFVGDEGTLREFDKFVESGAFDYISDVEVHLKRLEDKVAQEGELDRLDKPLRRVKKEIDDIEEKHWDANEELIQWKLTFDILEKAFGIRTAYGFDASADGQVARAREVLTDADEYESWFQRLEIGVADTQVVASTSDTSGVETKGHELSEMGPPLRARQDAEEGGEAD